MLRRWFGLSSSGSESRHCRLNNDGNDMTIKFTTLGLHSRSCQGKIEDVARMHRVLKKDSEALERLQERTNLVGMAFAAVHSMKEFYNNAPTYPLHDAVSCGHLLCVKMLLESGAWVHSRSPGCKEAYNPLSLVGMSTNLVGYEMIQYLVEFGANPNAMYLNFILPQFIYLPICNSLQSHNYKTLRLLLEQGGAVTDAMLVDETYKLRLVADTPNVAFTTGTSIVTANGTVIPRASSITPVTLSLLFRNIKAYKLLLYHGARNQVHFSDARCKKERVCEYSIPHFVLLVCGESYFATSETVMAALEIYKDFGGNLWTKNVCDGKYWLKPGDPPAEIRTQENALQMLRRSPDLLEKFPELEAELEPLMAHPLSLQKLSRIAVLKGLGKDAWKNVGSLPLPRDLQRFVRFDQTETIDG